MRHLKIVKGFKLLKQRTASIQDLIDPDIGLHVDGETAHAIWKSTAPVKAAIYRYLRATFRT